MKKRNLSARKKIPNFLVNKIKNPKIQKIYSVFEKNMDIYFKKAINTKNLHPINRAEISNLDFKEGSDLKFTAKFEVIPEFNLPKYDKIKINMTRYISTQTDMDKALEEIQGQFSTLKTFQPDISPLKASAL